MALINSFLGQQWRSRHREETYGHGGKRGGKRGDAWREKWKFTISSVQSLSRVRLFVTP